MFVDVVTCECDHCGKRCSDTFTWRARSLDECQAACWYASELCRVCWLVQWKLATWHERDRQAVHPSEVECAA